MTEHPGRLTSLAALLLATALASAGAFARHPPRAGGADAGRLAGCPVTGDALSARVRALNALKRRLMTPAGADIDPSVTLQAMLAPGDDGGRFDASRAAVLEGYVADVKVGGVESVNCHTHDPLYRDTHLELTVDPLHDAESRHVIVEVTPQWREAMAGQGTDWSTPALRAALLGRWVRVTGWLLYDAEHAQAAANTARPGAHVWRATAWELHPVTGLAVLPGRPPSLAQGRASSPRARPRARAAPSM